MLLIIPLCVHINTIQITERGGIMKRIKAVNGYTIMQATERDKERTPGEYYIYFSSDLRDFGLAYSEPEFEVSNLQEALDFCNGSNYAKAKEILESKYTCVCFDDIEKLERTL